MFNLLIESCFPSNAF